VCGVGQFYTTRTPRGRLGLLLTIGIAFLRLTAEHLQQLLDQRTVGRVVEVNLALKEKRAARVK
jgi:hypothetical protein